MNTNTCEGCISITDNLFPFTTQAEGGKKGQCIDQEGCGVDGHQYLTIRYCPVCGTQIHEKNKTI